MPPFAKPACEEAFILSGSCASKISVVGGSWIIATTILGSSMAFIDGTVVNVALPALQSALGATLSEIQWVVEAYALFLAALLLAGGALGDLYGRRKMFAGVWAGPGDSGEAERSFRKEAERHSGMIPNTIGA